MEHGEHSWVGQGSIRTSKLKNLDVFPTKGGGYIKLLGYIGNDRWLIQHQDEHKYTTTTQSGSIKMGALRNPFRKHVYGFGYTGIGPHKTSINSRQTRVYCIWFSMMKRVYSKKNHVHFPTYKGCSVDERWHNFQNFAEWFYQQPNHDREDFDLDKDLMVWGNKVYGPDTCSFVPCPINKLLTGCSSQRGDYPLGVSRNKGKYKCDITINGTRKFLGLYKTPEDAHAAYKVAKEKYVKESAEKYKELLHPDVYNTLINWKYEKGEI